MPPENTDTTTTIADAAAAPAGDAAPPADAPAPAPATDEPASAEDAISAALAVDDKPAALEGDDKPAAADDVPAPAEPAKKDGEPESAKPGDGKQDDPYAMPDGLSERAKARFEELAGRAKDAAVWKERAEQWQNTIESTGASPEQFGQLLTYSSLVNSGDPVKLRQAMSVLEGERNAIARLLGEEAPGIDLLSDHPDLVARVGQGFMDRTSALEVARSRAMVMATRQHNDRVQAEQQTAQTHQQAIDGLNVLGQQLAAQDPLYAQKYAALQPMLPIIARLPPAQWRDAFVQAYEATAVQAPAPAPKRLAATPQPLSGTAGGGGGNLKQQATSAQQAIEQALGIGG